MAVVLLIRIIISPVIHGQKFPGHHHSYIANTNAVQTQVTNLVQGIYQFELKVTDAGGLFSKDTMQVHCNQSTLRTTSINYQLNVIIASDRRFVHNLIPFGNFHRQGDGL